VNSRCRSKTGRLPTSKWNMSISRMHGVFSTRGSGTRAGDAEMFNWILTSHYIWHGKTNTCG